MTAIEELRQHALGSSLFQMGTLRQAVERMGFVQADPIRSPARAQDLILRQRVKGYRVGDIEREYRALGLEEDRLYAYGFMPRSTWRLLHPLVGRRLTRIEKRVIEIAAAQRQIHPRDLEEHFGRKTKVNAWGSQSKATTLVLQSLHYRGHLRVAGREKGIRIYEAAAPREPLADRLGRIVSLIVSILQPIPDRSLRATLSLAGLKAGRLLESADFETTTVDGERYLQPAGRLIRSRADDTVRFLAPFDPVVWDRRRFEHFWGWQYRFEAYTPAAKRQLGYYAMPMLWRGDAIGWVNVSNADGKLAVEPGFKKARPTDRVFRMEFEAEVERLRSFL